MKLATNITDYSTGDLGMVELAASYLNDRTYKRWSKPELIQYINQSQKIIAAAINRFYETYFVASATTTTVANQSIYSLPPEMIHFLGLEVGDTAADRDPKGLVEVHYSDRNFYNRLSEVNAKEDFGYFFIRGHNLELKTPDTVGGKTARVFYVERLVNFKVDGTDDNSTSKIPEDHHEMLSLGCARRARAKLGRSNPVVDDLYGEGMAALQLSIRRFSPQREERRRPFHGTYGPTPPIDGWKG